MAKYLQESFNLADYYDASRRTSNVVTASTLSAYAQSFTGDGRELAYVTFLLAKNGAPTGNLQAKLYAHSGTFGSTSVPTGTALAASTTLVSIATLGTLFTTVSFTFPAGTILTSGTNYCIAIEFGGTSDATNNLSVAVDNGFSSHPGNRSFFNSGAWSSTSADTIFSVYTNNVTTDALLLEDGTSYYILEDNTAPTIAPNTADLNAFSTTTPTLEFTGTDDVTNSNDLQYEIQIDTVNTFDSQAVTPTLVQTGKITNASATPGTVALTGVTAGNMITVSTTVSVNTAGIVSGVTDSLGNSYSKIIEVNNASAGSSITHWRAFNVTGGNPAISVAFNDVSTNMSAVVREYSGILATASPNDGSNNGTSTGSSSVVTSSVTTTQANDLLIGVMGDGGGTGQAYTAGTGYGNIDSVKAAGSGNVAVEDRIGATATAYTAGFTIGTIVAWVAAVIAYKAKTATPLLDKVSSTDAGFVNTINGGDTQPFNSSDKVSYTIQSALTPGTYYWRVRAIDPSGSNTYSSWSSARSFTVSSAAAAISTLTDDFASGPLDSTKWAGAYGNSPVFSGGRVSLSTTASSTLYSGWLSLNSYDLTGSAAFVQCITAGDQTQTGLETFPLQLEKDANNKLQWYVTNGTIYARKVVGGAGSTVLSATYSTVTHQWLRIRESGGTVFWDYSSDGTTWNNLTSLANPFVITSVKQEFAIGNYIGQPSTTATFDNFNLAPSFTIVSITKAMTYRVKTVPTAPTKTLKYTTKRTPSAMTKSLKYTVKKPLAITKGLIYDVKKSLSLTKTLKYTVKTTPAALTKSLRYATKAPTAPTKSLKYTIARPASALTKQLKYTVARPATAITKSLKYTVVKPASAITKSLKYAVKTIPTAKTKSLRYAINKPSAITKSLKYTVLKTPSAITRSLRYATAKPIAITKSLKYSVKAPAALTKSLKYTVTKSSALTKSLKYSVRTTGTAITKSAKYTVRKSVSITKGLIYDIKRPVAITKSLKYTTKTAVSITKSLKYGIKLTPSAITKQLKYEVKTATAITKSLTYRVKKNIAITKTLTYRTKTATAITKSLKYVAGSNSNLVNKSLKYTVKSPVIKTKQLIYDVKTTHTAITKSLAYDIRKATALTKTLVYDVKAPRQITKALKYTIKAPHAAITKPLKYAVVKPASVITRSLKYTVRTPVVLTKSLKYTVKSPHALTKSLTYNISGAGAIISRSLKYAVKRPVVVTKSLRYSIKTGAHNISKTLTYDVRRVNQITKSLTYRVVTTHVLTLALRYNVRRSSAITKALTYRALVPAIPRAISRSLEYDVHIAPQFHDPLILSQQPEPLYLTDSRYVIPMANCDSTIRLGEAANSGTLQLDVKSNSIMLE